MGIKEILSLIIMAVGFAIVYSARAIVNKFKLAEKQKCENAAEMTEEEIESYKNNRALFNIKVAGLVISIPGLILFIISFK